MPKLGDRACDNEFVPMLGDTTGVGIGIGTDGCNNGSDGEPDALEADDDDAILDNEDLRLSL